MKKTMSKLTDDQKEVVNKIILEEIIENGLLHIKEIKPEHKILDDLELDMFSFVSVVFNTERHFGITITDYDAETCETVNDLYELVYRLKHENPRKINC